MAVVKDKLWYFTFLAILLKCIIFLGFTIGDDHTAIKFNKALTMVYPRLPFYCAFIIIILVFAFLFKNRARIWYLIAVNAIVSVLLIGDLWYFRGYHSMLSLHLLRQTTNLNNLSDSIVSLIHIKDFLLIADVLLLFILTIAVKGFYRNMSRSLVMFAAFLLVSLSIIAYIPVKVNFFGGKDDLAIFKFFDPNITSYNLSPVGYHIMNVYSFWKDSQVLKLTPEDIDGIKSWFNEKKENLPDNQYKSLFKGKNLILIQVESLEGFVLNQTVNGQEITPNLNRLLKNSLYFSNIYEQVNEGNSSDSDLMTNTSVYPLRSGSAFFRYPYTTYNSLPKMLQNQGYTTLAIHSDKGSYWNWMPSLKSIGFKNCIDSTQFVNDEAIGMGLSDGSYFKQVEPIIVKEKQPFYTFMVTLSSHAPFNLPQKYRELKLDANLDSTVLGGYFQSVNYVDRQIGAFIDKLQKDGLLVNTVIGIYGDHESIHKYYYEEIHKLDNPESWWLENHKHIPLIIYQSQLQGRQIGTIGGQIDIMPTVAYMMGIDDGKYTDTAMGRSLLKTAKSFAVLRDGDYITDKVSEKEKIHDMKGLEIADTIIRSNYFKEQGY